MLQYTWKYDVYFDRLCTVSTILRPIFRHQTLADGPTSGSWSKVLSLGATRASTSSTGSISETCTARSMYFVLSVSRGSVLRILPVLQVFRVSILRVHICLCSRGSLLLIFSVLSVVGPSQYSQYVGLLSTRSILAACTPILSVLGLRIVLEHLLGAIFVFFGAKKVVFGRS